MESIFQRAAALFTFLTDIALHEGTGSRRILKQRIDVGKTRMFNAVFFLSRNPVIFLATQWCSI